MEFHYSNFDDYEEIDRLFFGNKSELNDLAIVVRAETEEMEFKIFMVYLENRFMIRYQQRENPEGKLTLSLYSLNDSDRIMEFYEIDESYYPASCTVDPGTAQQIFREFHENPKQPPPSANWLDSNELPWPAWWETREQRKFRGIITYFPKETEE